MTDAAGAGTGVFTEDQRAVFRAAGFWMRIVGWVEVAGGGLIGLVWVLGVLGVEAARQIVGTAPAERIVAALECVGGLVIGTLTLTAAASFRRAGPDPASVTRAAEDLRELYERQVWVVVAVLFVVAGAALAR
jgi:hypothetical protein